MEPKVSSLVINFYRGLLASKRLLELAALRVSFLYLRRSLQPVKRPAIKSVIHYTTLSDPAGTTLVFYFILITTEAKALYTSYKPTHQIPN